MVCRELDDVEMLIVPFEALESTLGSFRLAMLLISIIVRSTLSLVHLECIGKYPTYSYADKHGIAETGDFPRSNKGAPFHFNISATTAI